MIGFRQKKQALGIAIDGKDLRIAHLGWQDGKITIFGFDQMTLPYRLSVSEEEGVAAEPEESGGFGISSDSIVSSGLGEEAENVSSILISFFGKYPMRGLPLAVNIPEGQAFFQRFKEDFGLKGKALKAHLRREFNLPTGASQEFAMLDVVKSPDGQLTSVVFTGNIPLVETLIELRSFFPGGILKFSLIEPNEMALVNLARATLDLEAEEITVLVYIGREFSTITLLEGDYPLSFVQAIHEGYQSENVCQTLFSRILLEQEDANRPDIHRIVLAGEIGLTRAYEYFTKQFPEVQVEPIDSGDLDVSLLRNEDLSFFPNYALPVALAWETLDTKNPRFLRLNLMPDSIRKVQKFFQIAWHGFAVLVLIFVLMVGLSYRTLVRWTAIENLKHSIQLKHETIATLQSDLTQVGLLQEQIDNYETNLLFLNTHIVDPSKWSRLFSKLVNDFISVDNIWLESIASSPEGFTIVGKSLYRTRIPRLAYLLPNANLKRVTRMVTEAGEMTYQFEIVAGIPAQVSSVDDTSGTATQIVNRKAGVADGAWVLEKTGVTGAQDNPTSVSTDTSGASLQRR
jgi:hypothetical protein